MLCGWIGEADGKSPTLSDFLEARALLALSVGKDGLQGREKQKLIPRSRLC